MKSLIPSALFNTIRAQFVSILRTLSLSLSISLLVWRESVNTARQPALPLQARHHRRFPSFIHGHISASLSLGVPIAAELLMQSLRQHRRWCPPVLLADHLRRRRSPSAISVQCCCLTPLPQLDSSPSSPYLPRAVPISPEQPLR